MTLARRREEEERTQGKKISRGEIWTMKHKKRVGSYIHEDARTVAEAIKVIESCDQSTKELSHNESLAQVLGKEHSGRGRGMGAGPCPIQILNHDTQHASFASHVDVEEYKREIVELKAEVAEEKKKRQSMKHTVRYLLQQQGDNLPPNIAAKMNSLGSESFSTDTRDLQGPHDFQKKITY
ncbi:hypothetical protein PIB30_037227 [Stylosanthes scabra]|uniref:Uncharacterized protein n=1 Tax=Stylosanthes scabra TaxID=79078 RepID=A0ABU6QD93_9FABA|nr:hypothetical protein [Stylosanthes scabra]